ncbi:MAG: sensor histidine kinase [Candidatus Dormibacteria bacterium]
MRRLPIRARIALFGAGVVLLTVVVFGGLVAVLFERSAYNQQDVVLERRSQQLTSFDRIAPGDPGRVPGLPRRLDPQRVQVPVDLRTSSDTFIEFLDSSGAPLLSTGEVDARPPRIPASVISAVRASGHQLTTIEDADLQMRVAVRPLKAGGLGFVTTGQQPAYVAVGQSATSIVSEVNQLRLYLLVAALLSMIAALVASWLVAGRALRPLDDMTETVEAIGTARDLGRRLPEAPAADEVGRLSTAFNAMMGRLDDAYGRLEGALDSQRRFVADASHELRTPLTSIRSNLGLLLGTREISSVDRREALQDMDSEAKRMSRLVQDLLTLARADAGQKLDLTVVDLPKMCEEVCRKARRTYPGRHIELHREPVPPVAGEPDSLRQLLWILLDNAARHTGPRGNIGVTLGRDADWVHLSVADDGEGIPRAVREQVFERFFRADQARGSGGAGLGLSIARWIVEQHGGHIRAGQTAGSTGAEFMIDLPAAGQPLSKSLAGSQRTHRAVLQDQSQ